MPHTKSLSLTTTGRLVLTFLFLSFHFYSNSQTLNWAFKAGGTSRDESTNIHIDNAGNVLMTGMFSGTADFDPSAGIFNLTSAGSEDIFVAKYNAACQFLWAFRVGGVDRDHGLAITSDAGNNVIVTGFFRGSNIDFDPSAATANLTSNGDAGADPGYGGDIFVAKYNSAGQYQWAFNIGGSLLYDAGVAIVSDAASNIYVGGYFRGIVDFDPSGVTSNLNSGTGTIFLSKYSPSGNYQWAFNTGLGDNNNAIFDLKADNSGNLFVAGYFQGTNIDFDPSPAVNALSSNGGYEIFFAKYTTNGQYVFAHSIGGTGDDVARGIDIDNGGNIYLIGDFNGANIDFDPGAGTALLSSNGNADVFLAKYNNSGNYVWAFNFGGSANDIGWKVSTDNIHLYITGGFTGTCDMNPSSVVDNLVSNGGNDIFLGKYNLNGEYLCAFNIGGSLDDYGSAIKIASTNIFYLTGFFQGANVDFDPTSTTFNLSSSGGNDVFLSKFTWPDNIPPTGAITGGTICSGQQAQLTFNATAGTGPFTIVYNNGVSNITVTNVQSGVPFNIVPNPISTTTYTLVSIRDALRCSETALANGTATVTVNMCNAVTASFTAPDTVCVNTPVNITNTSTNATNYYWSFCAADVNATPAAVNLGNPGGFLSQPVFMDMQEDNGNYYGFIVNHVPGGITRLDFGNSLLNTPTPVFLGNPSNAMNANYGNEGIQIVKANGNWYGIIVGGNPTNGSTPRLVIVKFGVNLNNPNPTAVNWGNIGNMLEPIDLHVFEENGIWYGLTVNAVSNTITRFNFTNSFDNPPTGVNLGNIGNLNYPDGIYAINDNGSWHAFITNGQANASLTRLDFGNSLLNTPTGVNLGSLNGVLTSSRDITIIKYCGETVGFVVNGQNNTIARLNFATLTSVPTATDLGNLGNLSIAHSLSKLFRVGNDLYSFVTNVGNNTITRLRFTGCTNSNIPSSTSQNPAPIAYDQPGTYTINLTVDDGLPTQSSFCKQIVVRNCITLNTIINDYTPVLSFDVCKNLLNVEDAAAFNTGDTVLLIQMKGALIDSSNTVTFGTITDYRNAGNYEFNYVKSKNGNTIELLNKVERGYDLQDGKVQLVRVPYYQNAKVWGNLTCLPWDGSKGGVLAFNVADTLELNANIDVSGKGFRGGVYNMNPAYFCDIDSFYIRNNNGKNGANKGESIFLNNTLQAGRGKAANGGGGGNATNAGGGGGGNGGAGGSGGKQYVGPLCNTNFTNGGIGGINTVYSNAANKIFLGGGGGAGQGNEVNLGNGGNGGGIIIITANKIKTNNFLINSKGETPVIVPISPNDDGRSGGGAGGTVLLNYTTLLDNVNISVKGGNGDNCVVSPPNLHGPGGGGGGGIVWINQSSYAANITTTILGGTSGTNINSDPWGAANGSIGSKLTGLIIPIDRVLFKPNIDSVKIKDSLTSCSAFDFKGLGYTNTNPIASWQWFFGDGQTATTQNTSHIYTPGPYTVKLIVTDINGCKDSITKNITASLLSVNTGNDTTICSGQSLQLQASTNGGSQFQWTPAAFLSNSSVLNPTATPPDGLTMFVITATNASGCSQKDSLSVFVRSQNSFSVNSPLPICQNDSVQLFAQGGDIYLWQPSTGINSTIANPFVSPQTTTPYTVQITDTVCSFTQVLSTQVIVRGLPNIQAAKQNDIDCVIDFAQLNATGAAAYSWSPPGTLNNPSISNPVARPRTTTQYIVQGTDQFGCKNYDTLIVTVSNTGVNGGYLMPSAFTPNNDGVNDCFGIKYWGAIIELEFNIFNRWGERVFHTTNPADCWNGKFRGIEQKADVYVYWIRAKTTCESSVFRKGVVMLIR